MDAKPIDLEVGELLNNTYRLDALIGAGGMGRVFAATDLKLERKVAVKVLSVGNLDTETVRRFDRETQVMGQLDHPSVVTLFSFGRTRGVPWLAMRLLEGQDLWSLLAAQGGRLTPQALLPLVRQILAALSYLHGRGLLHRDLKPSNIHVGKTGKVTLCDFGLARGHQSSLTRTGVIWGTPEYMAPEQILGERELDGRADLYALAVVMFRMLAGVPLFAEADDNDVLRAHLSRPRPDIARLVPTLSPMVGAALQKGLAIHPEDRFQSAEEMLAALEMVLSMPLVSTREKSIATTNPPPRATGTKASVAPASQTLTGDDDDDSQLATRPHGFSSLPLMDSPEAEGDTTSKEGFSALTPTPPLEAVGPTTKLEGKRPTRDDLERTKPDNAVVPAPSQPVTEPAAKRSPLMPVPLLIGGAVLLFLFGLLVSKLLL